MLSYGGWPGVLHFSGGITDVGNAPIGIYSIYGLKHERILACGCIYIWMAPTSLPNDLKRLLGSWACANEPMTLLSQCAKQTQALLQALRHFSHHGNMTCDHRFALDYENTLTCTISNFVKADLIKWGNFGDRGFTGDSSPTLWFIASFSSLFLVHSSSSYCLLLVVVDISI